MNRCIFPGSFDPVTLGHLNLMQRLNACFDEVVVAVLVNDQKTPLFPVEERVLMIQRAAGGLKNVRVESGGGLLADFARKMGIRIICRGVRTHADMEYERQMALLNRMLWDEIETVFLPVDPQYMHISSSAVKQIGAMGGDVSALLPKCNAERVMAQFRHV